MGKIPATTTHHLRRLLFRSFSSSHPPPLPLLLPIKSKFLSSHAFTHPFFFKHFSSLPHSPQSPKPISEIAQSVATHLLQPSPEPAEADDKHSLSLPQRLSVYFDDVDFDPQFILQILYHCPNSGRNVLPLLSWLSNHHPKFKLDDSSLRPFIEHLGRNKDFKAIDTLLVENRSIAGPECFKAAVSRLVRAGRPTQAIAFFDKMEKEYGFPRTRESLSIVIAALCEYGFAGHAERFAKQVADEIFPDEFICNALVRGWCIDGKPDEARRLMGEINRGGFELGTSAYNSLLDCMCKLCRKKDPFCLVAEAEKVLIEMDATGIPRDVETFNVLISNLCKIRRTEDAVKLFDRMGEWGCLPNAETYILVIRSLYQAARIAEGDEMIDRMKAGDFVDALDKKAYYGFIKILCGIERIDHAMKVFEQMKEDNCVPGVKTYDLLVGKLYAHGQVARANNLFHDAVKKSLPMTTKEYKVDPRLVKQPKVKKEKPKRETLPMKMARKRKRLRKLRLSFVKKPKRGMRVAY